MMGQFIVVKDQKVFYRFTRLSAEHGVVTLFFHEIEDIVHFKYSCAEFLHNDKSIKSDWFLQEWALLTINFVQTEKIIKKESYQDITKERSVVL